MSAKYIIVHKYDNNEQIYCGTRHNGNLYMPCFKNIKDLSCGNFIFPHYFNSKSNAMERIKTLAINHNFSVKELNVQEVNRSLL